jgi:hypothetical protein
LDPKIRQLFEKATLTCGSTFNSFIEKTAPLGPELFCRGSVESDQKIIREGNNAMVFERHESPPFKNAIEK